MNKSNSFLIAFKKYSSTTLLLNIDIKKAVGLFAIDNRKANESGLADTINIKARPLFQRTSIFNTYPP